MASVGLSSTHIKRLRKAQGKSLTVFAGELGLKITELARYEKGEQMSAETAFLIANALDTTIARLCNLEDAVFGKLDVKTTVDETLRYLGHALFDIYDSGMKIVITLQSGETHWFFYSQSRVDRRNIIGEIVMWLMDGE